MNVSQQKQAIPLGQFAQSRTVADVVASAEGFGLWIFQQLGRHRRQDWGDVCPEDKASNDNALIIDARIISAYVIPKEFEIRESDKIWIITEADRSVTTVLFPSDY